MATETPMRMVESSQTSKWLSSKNASAFGSSFKSNATEDLGLFLKCQKFSQDKADFIPSRSGSAPPRMEGSVAAVGNMLSVKDSSLSSNSCSLGNGPENRKSEGQCLFDPSYVAHCSSNVNLDPRLPSRHLPSQIVGRKENQGMSTSDNGSLGSLSTHIEEPDKQDSLEEASEYLFEDTSILNLGQNAALLCSRHKSLVDLIQEDFPRTPSPVYNQSHLSSHATTDDSVDLDVHAVSSSVSSINISNLLDSATCSTNVVETGALTLDSCNLISNEVPSETFLNLQHTDGTKSPSEDQSCNKDAGLKDDVSTNELMHMEKQKLRASNAAAGRHKQEEKYYDRNKLNQSFAHGYPNQIRGAGAQVISQRMNNSQSYFGKLAHSCALFSSLGIQPSYSSPGLTGSLYASPTAFMTPGNSFYPNFHSSGLFAPQYSLDGYAVTSAIFPPYMAGYSSQGTLSLPFEIACGPNLNGQATTVSSGERVPRVGDFQNQSKFYGQRGLALQPSYVNPLNMQDYLHSFGDTYPAALQQSQLQSRNLTGCQISSLVSLQNSAVTAYLDGQKFQSPISGGLTIPSSNNNGIPRGSYFGNSSRTGVMMQFPALSLDSPTPILPYSPMSGTNPLGGQNEIKIPQISSGNAGFCFGQRGFRSYDDPKKQSFIEEYKSFNSGKFDLSDIAGRIVEFSIDQHGSRFIQQKLESCSAEERASVFEEILPHASKLMTDVFGNYVIQKFFEHGSPEQRKKLAEQLSGHMLTLSLHMYGCRVIQKVLEVIELDQKTELVEELDGHIMRCVHDQNGNHVIQKCIECIPMDKIQYIISAFQGQVATLSTHPYGCRVIQRVLEHCSEEQNIQCIVDEILESACVLAQDQYGNYVTQHVLERGKPHERSQIISNLTGKIVQLSQHKYASNVIEKCWEHSNAIEQEALIDEIIRQPGESGNLLAMMKDQFANFVVQKILETSNEKHRQILLSHIRVHLHALKKYTYGKHVVTRFEQLAGPGPEAEVP